MDVPANIENALAQNGLHVCNKLGKGVFGDVLKAKCRDDGKLYAIKILPLFNRESTKYRTRELELLTKLNLSKQNVIKCFKSWIMQDGDVQRLCIQMELCWVNLQTFIYENDMGGAEMIKSEGPPRFYQHVFPQILNGLIAIHSIRWIHRNIHPGHILIVNPKPQQIRDIHVKIAGFGLARYVGAAFNVSADGTINLTTEKLTPFERAAPYTAPELKTETYDFKVDVYSAGMVLYFISRYPVIQDSSAFKSEIEETRRGERDISERIYHKDDEKLSSLIKWMLQENANERPSASDAKEYMFPEVKDSTDGNKAKNIIFFARKNNEQHLRACSLSEFAFSALKAEVERRTRVIASRLRQEDMINGETMLIEIHDDEDVQMIFENAAQRGRDVVVLVTEKAEEYQTIQISSGDIMMQSPPETF